MSDDPTPEKRSPHVTAQQLLDVVANTLDPGYEAAAQRKQREQPRDHHRRPWYDAPLVAAGTLLVGFLLVVAYVHTNRGAPEAQRVHERLVERVRDAQDNADRLAGDLERTTNQLDRAQAAALPSSGALAQNLSQAQLDAGQVPVRGPGLAVTLAEPAAAETTAPNGRGGSVPIATTHILTDRDVRAVVNQIWKDGAEAIAVNGVRLTPTSAIRFAGEAVLVDLQPLNPPYKIEAIGDADRLVTEFAQSDVASTYQTRASASGIGFTFGNESSLELPASAPVTPKYASPAPSETPTKKKKKKADR